MSQKRILMEDPKFLETLCVQFCVVNGVDAYAEVWAPWENCTKIQWEIFVPDAKKFLQFSIALNRITDPTY
jgi:predicted phosphoadenosine phosphosulfate sulfurtransferase